MRLIGYLLLFLSALSVSAAAQETVFNVPSGDILARGKIYSEVDFTYRASDSLKTFTPRFVVGIGKRMEIGANINGISTPITSQTTVTPSIKWKAYDGGSTGWSFLLGNNLFIPVQNKTYNAGTWVYAELIKSWKTNTRATVGGYYTSRNVFAPYHRAGGQFALEQALTKRVTFAADWFTGTSVAGYVTTGLILKLAPKLTWYVSYQLGNSEVGSGNHQMLTEMGWNWN